MDPRRGLTASQAEALQEYRGFFGYRRINGQLREGDPDARTTEDVRQMDEAMRSSPLSSDVTVYRGVGDGEVLFGGHFAGDMTGLEWSDRAFTSTTASEASATSYSQHGLGRTGSGPVVMSIRAARGTGAVQLSQMDEDGRGSELLLDRGLAFRVTADHGVVDGARRIDVEIVR
ncbi:MAG TPA: ADP-ribosyltransferase [Micromonosporaceae bacterium]